MNTVTNAPAAAPKHTNRLALEKSPYLLQHAHNPVDWFAWGTEAFTKARAEDKPIFLSIGYSTCHWCHVMERESFEDEAVAAYLKAHFVSLKVDREERPDVDKIYMTFVQATTGSGGWPMNVFLTPDLKPFYGGTYFPPEAKHGRPSFRQLLEHLVSLWQTKRKDLAASADELTAKLQSMAEHDVHNAFPAGERELHGAGQSYLHEYDARHGGFGDAPKFPRPSQPLLLLRCAKRFGDTEAIKAVLRTCDAMAAGGIHDQLGGGFARYSVDARWLVPHFEKMLYDQAQLVQLYLEAYLISGEPRHADVARDIIHYVLRDLTHPEGGYYSAEDADSEGKEGKFYCWTHRELSQLLTVEEFNVAGHYYGITREGNFLDHSDPHPLPGQNVLSRVQPKLAAADQPLLAAARQKLLTERSKRVRPHLDDKVLASWNGMMLGAIARASAVLGDEEFKAAAEKNLAFLQARLWVPPMQGSAGVSPASSASGIAGTNHPSPSTGAVGTPALLYGTLYHRWRDGERDTVQLLDGYANLLAGVVELYEATVDPRHLEFAVALAGSLVAKFYDAANGGFWQTDADAAHLLLRTKEDYDGAEPSGNSVAALALLKLAVICDRKDWREAAEKSIRLFAQRIHQMPQAVPHLMLALDFSLQEPKRIALVGDWSCGSTAALLHAAHGVFQPHKVVLGNHGPVEEFARKLPVNDEFTQAYCCSGNACQPPTRDGRKLREFLSTP